MSPKIYKGNEIGHRPFQFQKTESQWDQPEPMEPAFQDFATPHLGQERFESERQDFTQVDVRSIITRAQEDADHIINNAREQAAAIEREAYEKGYEEGQKSGQLLAEQHLQAILARYHQSLTALDQIREILTDQHQLDFLDLVIHTAEKVIKGELKTRPHALLPMIKEALNNLKQKRNITILLNPDDHANIRAMAEEERQQWFGSHCTFEIDPGLNMGSFRLETPAGELDARIETQLELIRQQMNQDRQG